MKISGVKAMFGKVMAMGLFAGAVALLAPGKAQAQQVAFGVQFGSPYAQGYYAGDGRRDYYQHERWERERAREAAIAQHEAWERHERWEHSRDRDGYRDHDGYRDRDGGRYAQPNGYGYAQPNGYGYAQPNGYYGR